MQIHIKNYSGIKEINYTIQDNKINFLFGISGVGKSSIANALTNPNTSERIRVGANLDDIEVLIDEKEVNFSNNCIFDMGYMQNILINKNKEDEVYDILFGDGGNIEECKQEYFEVIKSLQPFKDKIFSYIGKINSLISDLKVSYLNDGRTYAKPCLVRKLDENYKKISNTNSITKYSASQVKWYVDGMKTKEYENGKCPFCNKKLSDSRKEKLSKLAIFDAKTYEKINSNTHIFDELSIIKPNWNKTNEVNKFNNQIRKYYDVVKELDVLRKYLILPYTFDLDNAFDILSIKPSKNLKELFPDIYDVFNDLCNKINVIKTKIIKLKVETDTLISKNIKQINNKLDVLGIPYKFEKVNMNQTEHKAKFIIRHINQITKNDMTEHLSFGEKNIIGLILFLLANKNKKMLIIDDPASSFDEYRRKILFDILFELHNDSTYLVLSHDHVFSKFAVLHYTKAFKENSKLSPKLSNRDKLYLNKTGNIQFVENYDKCIIKDIAESDFVSLKECVKNKISNKDFIDHQTALNLRLYYECEQASKYKKLVYNYLSAIIHRTPYDNIQDLITKDGKTEMDIINVINSDLGSNFTNLKSDYLSCIDEEMKSYSVFEKILTCRELVNSRTKSGKIIKDELSNIIHLNSAYTICLNPYTFNYFSKYVYNYIQENYKVI